MDTTGVIMFYLFVTVVYSWLPASIRPTTIIGWLAFIVALFIGTPIVAVPVSVLVCWLFHNYTESGSSGGLLNPNGFGGSNTW